MKKKTTRDPAIQSRFTWLIVAIGMVFAATVTIPMAANANTIALDGYLGPSNQITCTPSCEGFIGMNPGLISLSQTNADAYEQAGNPMGELARLNELLVQFNPPRPTVSFVNKTNLAATSYATSRQYFSIKKANDLWFFENTSGGEVSVAADGDAWSHTTEYGPVVPEPSSSSLLVILSLLGVQLRRTLTMLEPEGVITTMLSASSSQRIPV